MREGDDLSQDPMEMKGSVEVTVKDLLLRRRRDTFSSFQPRSKEKGAMRR